jgi:predicted transcriptional regulator
MQNLNPTLWRTSRMLAGKTRIRLLRCLHENPGKNVSELAKAVGIGVSDASQELRRIQSRGLIQPQYRGAALIYHFGADPQVRSAAPILKALRAALSKNIPHQDDTISTMAKGLGHRKRIAIIKSLIQSSKTTFALQEELQISFRTIARHLSVLFDSGLIRREKRILHYVRPTHPLAKVLVKLLPD